MKKVLRTLALMGINVVLAVSSVGTCALTVSASDYSTQTLPQDDEDYIEINEEELFEDDDDLVTDPAEDGAIEVEPSEDIEYTDDIEVIDEADYEAELAADSTVSGTCGASANWSYNKSTKTITISGKGQMEDYSLTNLSLWADYAGEMEKIVIKSGITSVGAYAFYNFTLVREMSLADSIVDIGDYAFYHVSQDCGDDEELKKAMQTAKPISFPSGLKTIGNYAFENVYYLRMNASTFPAGLSSVGNEAFYWSRGLVGDCKLTDNLKFMGYRAFEYSGLNGTVTIPSSLTTIPQEAFSQTYITGIKLPDTLKIIDYRAFEECRQLDLGEFVFPDNLEEIRWDAFECVHFTKITFGKNLKYLSGFSIRPPSYSGGDKGPGEDLTVIFKGDLPDMPTDWNTVQFDCYNVTAYYPRNNSTWDPAKLKELTGSFFSVVWVKEGEKPPVKEDGLTVSYDEETKTLTVSGKGEMVDYSIAETKPWSEHLTDMKKLVIGDEVESIGNYAFYGATSLEEVVLGKSLKSVGEKVFLHSKITELRFPAAFEYINLSTIGYHTTLRNVYFAGSAPKIANDKRNDVYGFGMNIFYPAKDATWTEEYCKELLKGLTTDQSDYVMFFPDSKVTNSCGKNITWKFEDGTLTIKGTGAMKDYRFGDCAPWMRYRNDIKNVVISEGITTIGAFAFYGLGSRFYSMKIPSTVKRVEKRAFSNVSPREKKVVFDDNCHLEYVGEEAFYSTEYGIIGIEKAMMNARLIDTNAFENSRLEELNDFETNAETIGPSAFSGCYYIRNIKLGPGVKTLSSGAFYHISSKEGSVEMGENIETIGINAFSAFTVKEFTIPDSVTSVGNNCCPYVTEKMTVGKGITDSRCFSTSRHKIDIYFNGNYVDLKAIKDQHQNIHYERYNGSWARGVKKLGSSNLTFVPEGEIRDVRCTVKFVTGTDTKIPDVVVKFGEFVTEPSLEKEGFRFDGWYTEKEFVNKFDFAEEIYEDWTLYAKWIDLKNDTWGDITEKDREAAGFTKPSDVKEELWALGLPGNRTYNGLPQKATDLRVYFYKTRLVQGKDFTVTYSKNKNPGIAKITIKGKGGYKGTVTGTYTIRQLSISMLRDKYVRYSDGNIGGLFTRKCYVRYDGKVHKAKPIMELSRNYKKVAFTEGVDYVLKYDTPDDDYKSVGMHVVTVEGKGKFKDSFTYTYQITECYPIAKATAKALPAISITDEFNGFSEKELVLRYNGKKLVSEKDYTVFLPDIRVGTARLTIVGRGDYIGTKYLYFKVKGIPLSKCYFEGTDQEVEYSDAVVKLPKVRVYADAEKTKIADYAISYKNNDKAGKATIIFTGQDKYEGVVKKTFKITPFAVDAEGRAVRNTTGNATSSSRIIVKLGGSFKSAKGGVKPQPEVYFITASGKKVLLENKKDYSLKYTGGKKQGSTGMVTITFKGNFKGKLNYEYNVE